MTTLQNKKLIKISEISFNNNKVKDQITFPIFRNKLFSKYSLLFSIWKKSNDYFYFNFIWNKNNKLVKRKITFKQNSINISNFLLEKEKLFLKSKYNTRLRALKSNNLFD